MQIYFAASIAGGRHYLETYKKMVAYMQQQGHVVLTEHIVAPDVWHQESALTAEQIYTRDLQWLSSADCVVAEVSNPSLGVGYEICYALNMSKPLLCLYHAPVLLSRMILGNTRPGILIKPYDSDQEWEPLLHAFLTAQRR
jgi:nucleoside 2-deoxyribosyltransferase